MECSKRKEIYIVSTQDIYKDISSQEQYQNNRKQKIKCIGTPLRM